jgi:phosphoglycerol transferase MdoB-like AlkP superfamily enzyme
MLRELFRRLFLGGDVRRIFCSKNAYALYFLWIGTVFLLAFGSYLFRVRESFWSELIKGLLPLIELAVLYKVCLLILPCQKTGVGYLRRLLFLVLPLLIGIVCVAQSYSLFLSNNYISVLAMENATESRLTNSWLLKGMIASVVVSLIVLVLAHLSSSPRRDEVRNISNVRTLIWGSFIIGYVVAGFLPQPDSSTISLKENQAPLMSLMRTYFVLETRSLAEFHPESTEFDKAVYYEKDSFYPFKKNYVFSSALPFERTMDAKLNVIVIYTEGLSARLIGAYGGRHIGLTPNIDGLLARSMKVDNYFNHTAATYRGLKGQMSSGYPYNGGIQNGAGWEDKDNAKSLAQINNGSVPQILRTKGYDTYFLSPHHDSVQLNTMLRALHFDKVYSFDALNSEFLRGKGALTGGSLSDKDIFLSLNALLKKREAIKTNRQFFIGLYNIGTHAFFDVPKGGKKYGDGGNIVLNRMHNYDYQLGQFLKYFFSSKYAKNTVLIFTSDHATYPEPHYVAAVQSEDYKPYFVDRIPLAIYDPAHRLPPGFDADGRTSLDFAPTLFHLLNIQNIPNSFLGGSVFEQIRTIPFGVAAIGGDYYLTDRTGVYGGFEVPPGYMDRFKKYKDYIRRYYSMERDNRVYPGSDPQVTDGAPVALEQALRH